MKKVLVLLLTVILSFSVITGCGKTVSNQLMTLTSGDTKINGEYSGVISFGKPKGNGTFRATDGWSFEGEFSGKELPEKGKVENYTIEVSFQEKSFNGEYSGEVNNLIPNGKGSFKNDDKENNFSYEGMWKNGEITGKGKLEYGNYLMKFSDHDRNGNYKGEVINGEANGNGTFTAVNSHDIKYVYSGEFKDGLPNGQGKMEFDDDNTIKHIGTFTNGDFTPSIVEGLNSIGTWKGHKFFVTEKEAKFIEENEKLFKTPNSNLNAVKKMLDNGFTYSDYKKESKNYEGKIVLLKNYRIRQVWVSDYFDTKSEQIEFTACDSEYDNYIRGFAIGNVKNVKQQISEDNIISIYVTPIAMTSYENNSGGNTLCMTFLLAGIE